MKNLFKNIIPKFIQWLETKDKNLINERIHFDTVGMKEVLQMDYARLPKQDLVRVTKILATLSTESIKALALVKSDCSKLEMIAHNLEIDNKRLARKSRV